MEGPSFFILCAVVIICSLLVHALYKRHKANQQATAQEAAARKAKHSTGGTVYQARTEERRTRSYLDMPSTPTPDYVKRMEALDKKFSALYTFDSENLRVERKKLPSAKDTWKVFLTTQQKKGNKKSIAQSYSKKAGQEERAEAS
jgi:hypothetical protein